jgi:hypothetical protein
MEGPWPEAKRLLNLQFLTKKETKMKILKDLIKAVDKLPKLAKIILCLPFLDIVWAVYRIVKGVAKKDLVTILIGVIWVIGGCTITWVFDLITTIMYGHPKLT